MVSIRFKVIEPLHFGGPGEFSPTARGPATYGRVLTMPQPSTVLGLLASLFKSHAPTKGSLGENYNIISNSLDCEFFIRGPYLISGKGKLYLPIDNLIVELSHENTPGSIYRYIIYVFAKLLDMEDDKNIKEITRQLFSNKVNIVRFLGVGLKRGLKIADEDRGLLYLEEYVAYDIKEDNEQADIYISVDLTGSVNLDKIPYNEKTVKLGGEQRIAKMYIEKNTPLIDLCKKMIEDDEYYLLIHLTPTIIETGDDMYITYKEISRQFFGKEDKIVCCIGKFGKDPLGVINLGFNNVRNARRPLKHVILPGSITIVEGLDKHTLLNICEKGIECGECDEVECNKVGYNTVLPIPISRLGTSEEDIGRRLANTIINIAKSG